MPLIEKLPTGSTSSDGINWVRHPTQQDIAEKVNEIIDFLNNMHDPIQCADRCCCKLCIYCVHDENYDRYWCILPPDYIQTEPDKWCSYGRRREGVE